MRATALANPTSRIRRLPAIVLAVAGAVVASSPGGRAFQTDFAGVESVAREELKERQTPGAAIAVVQDGRVVYAHGFGVANVETGEETRPEMLFRLGSTTKMFTAATVVLLAQQ